MTAKQVLCLCFLGQILCSYLKVKCKKKKSFIALFLKFCFLFLLFKPSFSVDIESSIESVSFDPPNNRNLISNFFRLASFAPKHHRDCLISKFSVNFEVSSSVFSDFFYLFYFNLFKKEVRFLVPFSKRRKLINFAEFFIISFMRQDLCIYQCNFLKLLCTNAGLTVFLEDFKHFV